MHNDREVTREEYEALVYRVDGLQDMIKRLYAALGVEEGTPIKAEN